MQDAQGVDMSVSQSIMKHKSKSKIRKKKGKKEEIKELDPLDVSFSDDGDDEDDMTIHKIDQTSLLTQSETIYLAIFSYVSLTRLSADTQTVSSLVEQAIDIISNFVIKSNPEDAT